MDTEDKIPVSHDKGGISVVYTDLLHFSPLLQSRITGGNSKEGNFLNITDRWGE